MSCKGCNNGSEEENNFRKSVPSYSNYINRKVAIQNFNSINNCNYAKNYNFNVKNNKLVYSNNYQSINNINFYIGNIKCLTKSNNLRLDSSNKLPQNVNVKTI